MHSVASRVSEHIFMTTYNKIKATGEGWEDKISTDKIPNDFCPDIFVIGSIFWYYVCIIST